MDAESTLCAAQLKAAIEAMEKARTLKELREIQERAKQIIARLRALQTH